MEIPKKIVWLASYPKSGNTWFRAFLTALLNDGEVDINDMKTDGIFSSRQIFDMCTDIDSTYLSDDEVKILQPRVFNCLASITNKDRLFIKVHDAYTYNRSNEPIIPVESTICAIYFIRNPLDVVCSFANHIDQSIDNVIDLMNNPDEIQFRQKDNLNVNNQFKQAMLSWSGHVESWVSQSNFPIHIVKFEDMLLDPITAFTQALNFIGILAKSEKIERAVSASCFSQLKQKENEGGFREKCSTNSFFRKGESGSWKKELNKEQENNIVLHNRKIMQLYNYLASC